MNKDQLVAIYAIVVGDPHVAMIATGHWNADGSPIMKKATRTIQPGSVFPVAWLGGGLTEAAQLVAAEAARWSTEHEEFDA